MSRNSSGSCGTICKLGACWNLIFKYLQLLCSLIGLMETVIGRKTKLQTGEKWFDSGWDSGGIRERRIGVLSALYTWTGKRGIWLLRLNKFNILEPCVSVIFHSLIFVLLCFYLNLKGNTWQEEVWKEVKYKKDEYVACLAHFSGLFLFLFSIIFVI